MKYNRVVGQIQKLIAKLITLKASDSYRIVKTRQLVDKLFEMGLINSRQGLEVCEKVNVASFCRRRLPVVLQRLKMAETVKEAVMYIEQGHIKVGVETVTDPARPRQVPGSIWRIGTNVFWASVVWHGW